MCLRVQVRNNNSSRFGKYIKLQYNPDGRMTQAQTTQFLLEKSRLVGVAEKERNYHVFYQVDVFLLVLVVMSTLLLPREKWYCLFPTLSSHRFPHHYGVNVCVCDSFARA